MFNLARPFDSLFRAVVMPFGEFDTEWCNIPEMRIYTYSPFYGWYSYLVEGL